MCVYLKNIIFIMQMFVKIELKDYDGKKQKTMLDINKEWRSS